MQGSSGDADIHNRLVDTLGKERGDEWRAALRRTHRHMQNGEPVGIRCVAQSSNSVLCDNLERWDRVENGRERPYICLRLIHVDVWQKPIQHCKAIILQLKTNVKKIKHYLLLKYHKTMPS